MTDLATNSVWGSVTVVTEDDVNAAVDAAFITGPWSKTTPFERAEIMLRMIEEIEARATELSLTKTLEKGSPVAETSVPRPMPQAFTFTSRRSHQSWK